MAGAMAMAQERWRPRPRWWRSCARGGTGDVHVKTRAPLEANVVTGAPYSADVISESIETLGDGNRIVRRTTGACTGTGKGECAGRRSATAGSPRR